MFIFETAPGLKLSQGTKHVIDDLVQEFRKRKETINILDLNIQITY